MLTRQQKRAQRREELQTLDSRKKTTGPPAVYVAMPTRDGRVSLETHVSLSQSLRDIQHVIVTTKGKPVEQARNDLAKQVQAVAKAAPFPLAPSESFVLWVDDDASWPETAVSVALRIMAENPCVDVLCGWFTGRAPFGQPFAYREAGNGLSFPKPGLDCAEGAVCEIQSCGFHWVVMRSSVLDTLGENPFSIPSGSGLSEDMAFCAKAIAAGLRIFVATGIPIAHIDVENDAAYLPNKPSMIPKGNALIERPDEHARIFRAATRHEYEEIIDKQKVLVTT